MSNGNLHRGPHDPLKREAQAVRLDAIADLVREFGLTGEDAEALRDGAAALRERRRWELLDSKSDSNLER